MVVAAASMSDASDISPRLPWLVIFLNMNYKNDGDLEGLTCLWCQSSTFSCVASGL